MEEAQCLRIWKALMAFGGDRGEYIFCIISTDHLSICSQINALSFFAPHCMTGNCIPRLPCSGFWTDSTERANGRGLESRKEALVFLLFLHPLYGSNSSSLAPGSVAPVLGLSPLRGLEPAPHGPNIQAGLVTLHLPTVSLCPKDVNSFLLLLSSRIPHHSVWFLYSTKTYLPIPWNKISYSKFL